MTDREILDEIYQRLCNMLEATDGNGTGRALKSFIEEEWQKRDEKEIVNQYNRNREPKDHIIDVSEIERRDGLELNDQGLIQENRWLDPQ